MFSYLFFYSDPLILPEMNFMRERFLINICDKVFGHVSGACWGPHDDSLSRVLRNSRLRNFQLLKNPGVSLEPLSVLENVNFAK